MRTPLSCQRLLFYFLLAGQRDRHRRGCKLQLSFRLTTYFNGRLTGVSGTTSKHGLFLELLTIVNRARNGNVQTLLCQRVRCYDVNVTNNISADFPRGQRGRVRCFFYFQRLPYGFRLGAECHYVSSGLHRVVLQVNIFLPRSLGDTTGLGSNNDVFLEDNVLTRRLSCDSGARIRLVIRPQFRIRSFLLSNYFLCVLQRSFRFLMRFFRFS